MGTSVFVKVVGFRDVERHAINTLFRLSTEGPVAYSLWTQGAPAAPQLALVDSDAPDHGEQLAASDLPPELKLICVGAVAPAGAWRQFVRPLHWPDIVQAMDSLFAVEAPVDELLDFVDTETGTTLASGAKASLLVDASQEDRMYLRARLALAGRTDVDDAASGAVALELASRRQYDLAIVGLETQDTAMDGWTLIRRLLALEPAPANLIVCTSDKSVQTRERVQAMGCQGLLEKPYDPLHVIELLEAVASGPAR